jgi:hypothetical protein
MAQHVDVTWVALECRRRQEGSDEIYGTVNAIMQDGQSMSHKFPGDRPNWEMGEHGERIVTVAVPIYSGPPIPLNLTVTLVEHDSGNIDAYKEKVAQLIAQAAGAVAASFTSGASAPAQPAIDLLSRGLVDVSADVLGTADDAYNPANLLLLPAVLGDPNRPRQVLRRSDDPRTAEYTDVIAIAGTDEGGDPGDYAFYFDVRVSGDPDLTPYVTEFQPMVFLTGSSRTVRAVAAHSGKVLDVKGASKDNGAPIHQWDWVDGDNQKWRLDDVGSGLWRIVSVHSGKVLDVKDASKDNGAPIVQWDWWGGDNQKWRLEHVGGGIARIVSVHSGKVLDVKDASRDNGAPIVQWDWWGGDNQKWQLAPLDETIHVLGLGMIHPIHP